MNATIHIRLLETDDILIVAALAKKNMIYPWSEQVFQDCMKADYRTWVICDADAIFGFVVVLNQLNECQLLNICIDQQYQRAGYGRQLLHYLFDEVRSQGLHRISLEVRRSNSAAIALYYPMGFIDVGLRKNYYPTDSGREDALIMMLEL